jgi:hypothetical protein
MKLHVFASLEERVHDKEVKSCRCADISACARQEAAESVRRGPWKVNEGRGNRFPIVPSWAWAIRYRPSLVRRASGSRDSAVENLPPCRSLIQGQQVFLDGFVGKVGGPATGGSHGVLFLRQRVTKLIP